MDIFQSVVHVGEGALHSLGEASIADEGTDTTSPTREGWHGQHVGSSVPMLPPSTLQIHPHRPLWVCRVWSTPVTPPSLCIPANALHGGTRGGTQETEARGRPARRGEAVGKGLHGADAQPPGASSPRLLLPLLCPAVPRSTREQWQFPGPATKRRHFQPPLGSIRSLPARALTGGKRRPAGRRRRAPGAGSASAGPASGTCGPRSSRSSGSSRSSIPPAARG